MYKCIIDFTYFVVVSFSVTVERVNNLCLKTSINTIVNFSIYTKFVIPFSTVVYLVGIKQQNAKYPMFSMYP